MVISAHIYDAIVRGTDYLKCDIWEWAGTSVSVGSTSSLPKVDAQAISDSTTAANNVEANIGNLDAKVSSRTSLGSGGTQVDYYVFTDEDAETGPIADVTVWVTTDQNGTNVVASGVTDDNGKVTFYLDAGTYYFWRRKSGYNFSNPDSETIS